MLVKKRDGSLQKFDKDKIKQAIIKANNDTKEEFKIYEGDIDNIVDEIINQLKTENCFVHDKETYYEVEQIQDIVELSLQIDGYYTLAKNYIKYRYKRQLAREVKKRDDGILTLIQGENKELEKENSNKDTRLITTMRDYMAGEVCKDLAKRVMLPKDIVEAHENGIIHFHDMDYSPLMPMSNCCLINLEDMLQNGTVISGIKIEKPHSFSTACNIATQAISQVASSQFGGNTINLAHLVPFVDVSRQDLIKEVESELDMVSKEIANKCDFQYEKTRDMIVEKRLKKEIAKGVQTIQYQLITFSTTNGQSPFTSVFMYLGDAKNKQEEKDLALIIEEMLKQRIEGVLNEQGKPITVAFPKLLYVLDENNIHEDSEYYYLTKLAAECSTKRLVPDYISAKKMRELKNGDVYACMGCRSFLSPYKDENDKSKYWGRLNLGVVTLNLVDIACSSKGDMNEFWKIFDERLELCYRALMYRYNRLKGTPSDVAPILWQHGALARLKKGETIDKLLVNGYSTISLGYAGLSECVYYMTGKTLLEDNHDFGKQVMQKLNDACDKWKNETTIGFSVYGSPIESTTYKFAKCLQKRFGKIKGVTDKKYITNSYHITPAQEVDAFTKLSFESAYQEMSLGGSISYVETPNLEKNIDAMMELIKHIYDTIMYAEVNTTTSYCHVCGCTDIKMEDDLKYRCPNCGNDDFNKMNVAVRICGYISTNPFNDGRAEDIHDRVYHLSND